jgi:hypothetical protein
VTLAGIEPARGGVIDVPRPVYPPICELRPAPATRCLQLSLPDKMVRSPQYLAGVPDLFDRYAERGGNRYVVGCRIRLCGCAAVSPGRLVQTRAGGLGRPRYGQPSVTALIDRRCCRKG